MDKISFTVGCKRFFGLKPGQTSVQFVTEVKALSPDDRAELTPLLTIEINVEVTKE